MQNRTSYPPALTDEEDGVQEPEFKPLTREQAQQWRSTQPELSPWHLVAAQCLMGLGLAALAALVTRSVSVSMSVLYGACAVALPSALMAWGMTSSALARSLSGVAQAALAGFFFWEGVKILLAMAMLVAARWVVPDLSWPGLLIGLVLVLKVYWLGFWIQSRRSRAQR
ncbi:ATP synthase subunit I [Hydrogenophaga sp. R2]|uniref:ATP synthase subunit I n=1 Tax=Hydrogenophaga sp. R2 TaxID=3132827 RepID=UPI003CEE911E